MDAVTYSTDLLSFFLPSDMHPVFGELVWPVYQNFTGNISENTTYIGYTVIFLSIVGFYVFRKDITVRFWGMVAIFFSLLSMGPLLHVAGETVFTVFTDFTFSVPLPHLILYNLVPFLENSRTTGRFFIVAALAFAVLAGYGCSELIKRYDTKKTLIVSILCAFVIFEYIGIPYPVYPVDQPAYYQKIGQDPEQYALLEIPITARYGSGIKIMYYQTMHGKPVIGGQTPRMPANANDFEKNTPFINEITYLKPLDDILNQDKNSTAISVLRYYNIRYIILHKEYLNVRNLQIAQDIISELTTAVEKKFEDDTIIVYQVESGSHQNFIMISDGWNSLETWETGPGRWIRKDAEIKAVSTKDRDSTLSFEVGSLNISRDVSVYLNNEWVNNYKIDIGGYPDQTPDHLSLKIHLKKGENIIKFSTPQAGTVPEEIGAWNDTRELSLAFQNITIAEG